MRRVEGGIERVQVLLAQRGKKEEKNN